MGSKPTGRVWIRASVEQMRETVDYLAIPRDEWEAMTPAERMATVDDFGVQTMNNAGGYGASTVDESDVPDEYITED